MEHLKNKLINFENNDIFPLKTERFKNGILYKAKYADDKTLYKLLENQMPGIIINDDEDGNYDKEFYSAEKINDRINLYKGEIFDNYEVSVSLYKELKNNNDIYFILFSLIKSVPKNVFDYLDIKDPHNYLMSLLIEKEIYPVYYGSPFYTDDNFFTEVFVLKKHDKLDKWYFFSFIHPQPEYEIDTDNYYEYEKWEGRTGIETFSWSFVFSHDVEKEITKYITDDDLCSEGEIIDIIKAEDISEISPADITFSDLAEKNIELLQIIKVIFDN